MADIIGGGEASGAVEPGEGVNSAVKLVHASSHAGACDAKFLNPMPVVGLFPRAGSSNAR